MTILETKHNTVHVQVMPPADLSRAAALIAESFREEGFTRNTLDLSTPAQQARFAEAVELRLLLSRARGERFFVATSGETLVGIAVVKPPTPEKSPGGRQKFALPVLGVAGLIIGLALLWRWLRSRES